MKKVIFILAFLSFCISSEAQKFLRYQMKNNTYNGFYTKSIESIIHDDKDGIVTAFVHTSGKIYEIPISDIDYISIEDAGISNNDIGEYRIYEFNYEGEDVKKIYVDNRASLFASRKGDFGANDTILFSSAYNEISWLFYTDNQGCIKKFFDGNILLYFDYDSDSEFTTLNLSTNDSNHYSFNKPNTLRWTRANSFSQVSNFFSNLVGNPAFIDMFGGIISSAHNTVCGNFAQHVNDVANNPELHNQSLIVDYLSVTGDLVGVLSSLFAEPLTLGWSTASLATSAASLMNNLANLRNHLFPDTEQMNKYKEYYRNKYAITVKTITPENVKSNKADIRGTFMSFNGIKGNLYFSFSQLFEGMKDRIIGSPEAITSNSYIVKGSATNLKPGTDYIYMLWYECEVDGMHFSYPADNSKDFTTPIPSATTIGIESYAAKSAVVKCSFSNVPEGATCGVQYGDGENSEIVYTSASDGEKTINLSALKPSTTYSYRAFILYEGDPYYGETKSFTTLTLPTPVATTGEPSSITDKSAIIECTFSNVPDGGKCGVEFSANGDSWRKRSYGSSDGTYSRKLVGLKPATKYTYRAFIEAEGIPYYGEKKTFTTEFPDLSGVWTFNQHVYVQRTVFPNLVFYYKSSDGSVTYHASGYYGGNDLSCTFYADRTVIINCGGVAGYGAQLTGKINESFTSVSGVGCYFSTPNGTVTYSEEPWTFSKSQ